MFPRYLESFDFSSSGTNWCCPRVLGLCVALSEPLQDLSVQSTEVAKEPVHGLNGSW